MYTPSFYRENSIELIAKLIRENSLATIISTNSQGQISVSHIPLVLKSLTQNGSQKQNAPQQQNNSQQLELLGHMARANPHWKELKELPPQTVKIIFQGPNGYITPAWYIENADNVPTWNYAVVHVTADFEILTNPADALKDMQEVIGTFEQNYGTNWQLASSETSADGVHEAVHEQTPYIVVFRFKNLKFDAKFKLGQKLDTISRETVISELKVLGEEKSDSTLFDLAEYMELTRKE